LFIDIFPIKNSKRNIYIVEKYFILLTDLNERVAEIKAQSTQKSENQLPDQML